MKIVKTVLFTVALLAAFAQGASAQTADEIAERYLNAVGGRANLAKIKSRHLTGSVTLSTPAGDIPGTVESFTMVPNKSRTVMKLDLSAVGMGSATIDQRFNGDVAYLLDSLQGNRDITGNQLDNLKNGSFPTPFLNYKERGSTAEMVGKEKVGDRDVHVLLVRPKAGSVMRAYFDAESGLLLKLIVVVNVPQIGDVQQTTEFSDYRDQDGIKIPFRVKNSSPIQSYTVSVTKVEHNTQIDETMFSKPADRLAAAEFEPTKR